MNRELAMLYLSNAGAVVRTAVDGIEAVKIAKSADIDAILLDWNMPGMNGKEVLLELNARHKELRIPFVVLTGEDKRNIDHTAYSLGVAYVLEQPVSPAKIVDALALAIREQQEVNRIDVETSCGSAAAGFDFRQYLELRREGISNTDLRRLFDLFLQEGGALVASFIQAATSVRGESCRKILHAICGMAHAAGATGLACTTSELLRLYDRNELDWQDAQVGIATVWESSVRDIEKWWSDLDCSDEAHFLSDCFANAPHKQNDISGRAL